MESYKELGAVGAVVLAAQVIVFVPTLVSGSNIATAFVAATLAAFVIIWIALWADSDDLLLTAMIATFAAWAVATIGVSEWKITVMIAAGAVLVMFGIAKQKEGSSFKNFLCVLPFGVGVIIAGALIKFEKEQQEA